MNLEQVTAADDFPIGLWEDVPMRDTAWKALHDRCAEIAATKGMTLSDKAAEQKSVLYMQITDDPEGGSMAVETVREHADVARLRLAAWAEPQ